MGPAHNYQSLTAADQFMLSEWAKKQTELSGGDVSSPFDLWFPPEDEFKWAKESFGTKYTEPERISRDEKQKRY